MYRAQLWGMKRSNFKGGTRRTWLENRHWKPLQANAATEWDCSLHNHHIALLLFWDVFCATVQLSCSSVPCCIQPVWCHAADTPHGGNYGNTCLPFKNAALKWILWYILWKPKWGFVLWLDVCVRHLLISAETCVCACLFSLPGEQHQSVTAQCLQSLNICVLHILSSMFLV